MNTLLQGYIAAESFAMYTGMLKPDATASSANDTAATAVDKSGNAAIIDVSSRSSSVAFHSDGPVVLIPQDGTYVPVNPTSVIDGKSASQVAGAITVKGGVETVLTSSSSSAAGSLYTASGTTAMNSQASSVSISLYANSGTSSANSEDALIAKLFSDPTNNKDDTRSQQLSG
nr:hypothetical protein [Acetobacter fallax]